ncbi:MAG: ATP-binding cassette domain-containing protein [Solirubrobacterales bacterium]
MSSAIRHDETPVLRLKGFGYTYPDTDAAGLSACTIEIGRGEFVLICGRSGSGKSTLLRAAAGLVPHHFGGHAEGEASICGLDLRGHGAAEISAVCGTVLQDPEVQIVMGSVRHEIAFPLENLGWAPDEVDAAVEETAAALGITGLLDRRTAELSGGELQRVVVAAALASRPPLLVLDEPTSQLDADGAADLFAALRVINLEWGTAILVAEHRVEHLLSEVGRVMVFDDGAVVHDGSPERFREWASAEASRRWLLPADRANAGASVISAQTKPVVLRLENAGFTYPGSSTAAVDAINLTIRAGERIALCGPNGSGKSTLLRLARGLITCEHGSVDAAGAIGLLMQNPNDYLIHDRVSDEAPDEALCRFGLAGLRDRDPRDLSGGERQRLALAIVTQDNPVALLLDEPTRGMDRELKHQLAEQLIEMADAGVAVVLATHDAVFAAEFAHRVLTLDAGRLVEPSPVQSEEIVPVPTASARVALTGVAR